MIDRTRACMLFVAICALACCGAFYVGYRAGHDYAWRACAQTCAEMRGMECR